MHWGYIDKVGKVIIPIEYDEGKYFREDGLALVKRDGKYGYIDTNGKELIPLIYDEVKVVTSYNFGCYGVKSKGKWQFVDKTGVALMDLQADDILEEFALPANRYTAVTLLPGFDVPTALVLKDYETFRVDKTGKVIGEVTKVLPKGYEKAGHFFNGLATVQSKGKWGCIDKNNVVVIPFLYDGIYDFNSKLVICLKSDKYGFLDSKGNEVIPLLYEGASSFAEGLAGVKMNGKWGFVNENGTMVIPCLYEQVEEFKSALSFVQSGGKWGAINAEGKVVIPFNYDGLGGCNPNCRIASSARSAEWATVGAWADNNVNPAPLPKGGSDNLGCTRLGCSYGDAQRVIVRATIKNKCGYLSNTGKIVVPIKYDDARCPSLGILEVKSDEKTKYFDYSGKRVQR